MMTGRYREARLGACTDCRRFWAEFRGGRIDEPEIRRIETRLATTAGTCPVMGTASTMACLAETLGMMLPGTAAIPAVHADRLRAGEASGMRAVALAREAGPTPRRIVTPAAVENALRVLLAIGGSTNGILHLTAIAGRAGIEVSLERFNELSDQTPVLVDLKPTGPHYMEDLFAGRRARRRAARARAGAPSGRDVGHGRDPRRAPRERAGLGRSQRGAQPRGAGASRRAAWWRCSAASRPAAPS